MDIFLVVGADYDYGLIDSAWPTQAEAEFRIEEAQALTRGDEGFVEYSYNFRVMQVKFGEVLDESSRFL